MGRALVKGLVSPTTFDELECIDGGEFCLGSYPRILLTYVQTKHPLLNA